MSDKRMTELLDAYDEAKEVHLETVAKWRLLTVGVPLTLLVPLGGAIAGAVGAGVGVNTGPIAFVLVPFGLLAAVLLGVWFGATVPRESERPDNPDWTSKRMVRPGETKARMRKAERAYSNYLIGSAS